MAVSLNFLLRDRKKIRPPTMNICMNVTIYLLFDIVLRNVPQISIAIFTKGNWGLSVYCIRSQSELTFLDSYEIHLYTFSASFL